LKKFIFTVPTIVDSIKGDDDFGKQDLLAQNKTIEPPPPDDNIIPDDNPGKKTIDVPEPPEPPTWVPEMPVFPGGESELYHYLNKNLEYPDVAKESNISGTVYLTFVVEKDGSISDVKILRGIGGGCDEEAIRVVKSMPPWTPGKNNGTPVRVRFNLPVKFTLQ
jgi:protein TonB